ncbi:hypothetical protein [Burkholderia aenigmatica]|uniref:hypothetical protein n=1 Tax=Burkholderia aenigmatica TaxID=2015348 RepID=UPI00158166BB|nr:hypothetical protein [Burkholderia aenigmatica]
MPGWSDPRAEGPASDRREKFVQRVKALAARAVAAGRIEFQSGEAVLDHAFLEQRDTIRSPTRIDSAEYVKALAVTQQNRMALGVHLGDREIAFHHVREIVQMQHGLFDAGRRYVGRECIAEVVLTLREISVEQFRSRFPYAMATSRT